jgi:hypothetical protein
MLSGDLLKQILEATRDLRDRTQTRPAVRENSQECSIAGPLPRYGVRVLIMVVPHTFGLTRKTFTNHNASGAESTID